MSSYLSPKVEKRHNRLGFGIFAKENIGEGEIVADYENGRGKIVKGETADRVYNLGMDYILQIDDDLFWVAMSIKEVEDADFINHSCEPNCGILGSMKIVAMRDIKCGEEIAFDYAMSESSDYEFNCLCGRKNCRKIVSGDDWKLPKLRKKYKDYFSDYLKKKIGTN